MKPVAFLAINGWLGGGGAQYCAQVLQYSIVVSFIRSTQLSVTDLLGLAKSITGLIAAFAQQSMHCPSLATFGLKHHFLLLLQESRWRPSI